MYIYIYTYFVYPLLIIFSNIFTHIDIYNHACSLAPSRYTHKPHPAFKTACILHFQLRSAPEILKHNGWNWTDLVPADRTKVFEEVLKDCYEREGITTQQDPPLKREHPTNPLLSKYYYIHRPEQAITKEAEHQTSEVRVDTADIQVSKMKLALGDQGPDIKIEPFVECQSSWKVVDSAKTKVSKEYEAVISFFKDLKAMHQNPGKHMKKMWMIFKMV